MSFATTSTIALRLVVTPGLLLAWCAAPLAATAGDPAPTPDQIVAPTEQVSPAAGPAVGPAVDPRLFPVPEPLGDAVDFWYKIYTQYPSTTKLLHDEQYLGVIYAALDFSKLEASMTSERRKQQIRREHIQSTELKYKGILDHLARGTDSDFPDEQERLARMFESVPGGVTKYTAAKSRLRTQTCLRDHFAEAIERSGTYLPSMEEIFRARGLPTELTRLPFVESMFQWHARSAVAAGGIWQFMPSTARHYLSMTAEFDQRYDPLIATDAAARLLADNYADLKSWPLAITAYNHGRYGMKRAAQRHGADLGAIVENYRSRTFGFASRNFYAEFIAAARVYHERRQLFPGVEPSPPLEFERFTPDHYVPIPELTTAANGDHEILRSMNPAVSREVWNGDLYLPKGYELRVPKEQLASFHAAYDGLPDNLKTSHQTGLRYRVRSGDSLSVIASRYGTSVSAIQRANGLNSAHHIRAGQELLIPPKGGARYAVPGTATAGGRTHTVRRGESLAKIARRYGTTVAALRQANAISGSIIQPAQILIIP